MMSLAQIFRRIGFAALATLSLAAISSAQYASQGVVLKSRVSLTDFGASAGNDCWGYVSPSGREYAIMGLRDRTGFVEITNPSSPVILTTIPHSSSTWSDIKVYRNYAYIVSEASGVGIQIVDLSDIDNGNVTLVKTLTSPGRSHNVIIDEIAGYLYTCGSNNGTGTTMCFSLADPANPVQVGPASMTTNYMHDGIPVTYSTGPLAGKTLWFGFSESRGVDIYDFTNKANPVFIKRVTYPTIGYCHQGWISEDKKYLYVDDELDESNETIPTRSLVFNVEDPYNAFFVGTFSSGLPAIDHNQYIDDGFAFQANYRSGLRIFDVGKNPTAPVEVGFFDTYPADDNRGFNGAWSTYPYFPSGTVIVSDINRGLFVLDASEALTRTRWINALNVNVGRISSGGLSDIVNDDNNYLTLIPHTQQNVGRTVVSIDALTDTFDLQPDKIQIHVRAKGNIPGYDQQIEIKDVVTNDFVLLSNTPLGVAEGHTVVDVTQNLSRYVNPVDKQVVVRVRYTPSINNVSRLIVDIDQIEVKITR